ncbi:PEPxxWA-CTERM sorting domain-containing protein [Phenylobacterium sp.]|uniref:PEPxxWA-CTERM sorting domain-containing protein n=1 Tax=Phenylobacterium sp. TaxID=1871053 RepID=UPI002ED96732
MTKLAYGLAATAAVLSAAAAFPAAATVILDVGPGVLQPDENILFNNDPAPDFDIEGATNQTATLVTLTGGETLTAFGGQARVRPTDIVLDTTFTFNGLADQLLGFDFSDPALAFTELEFRVFGGTATELTLTVVDTAGEVFQETFAIPKSGYFSARAIDSQLIDYFSLAVNGTLGDIRQVRVGGVQDIAAIPEPATWALMIMGFGAAGATLRTRRRLLATA